MLNTNYFEKINDREFFMLEIKISNFFDQYYQNQSSEQYFNSSNLNLRL